MSRRRTCARTGFTLALLAVVGCQALLTWPVRSSSFLLPACVLVPTAGLLVVQLVIDAARDRTPTVPEAQSAIARAVAWLLLMPALLATAGLVFGGALYTLLYLRLKAGESWMLSGISTAAVGGVLALFAFSLQRPGLFDTFLW